MKTIAKKLFIGIIAAIAIFLFYIIGTYISLASNENSARIAAQREIDMSISELFSPTTSLGTSSRDYGCSWEDGFFNSYHSCMIEKTVFYSGNGSPKAVFQYLQNNLQSHGFQLTSFGANVGEPPPYYFQKKNLSESSPRIYPYVIASGVHFNSEYGNEIGPQGSMYIDRADNFISITLNGGRSAIYPQMAEPYQNIVDKVGDIYGAKIMSLYDTSDYRLGLAYSLIRLGSFGR